MKTITLDAKSCITADDVYDVFFREVGAPDWHGRNFNALADSIAAGRINRIEVPYTIVVTNFDHSGPEATRMLIDFKKLIEELAAQGCEVVIEFER